MEDLTQSRLAAHLTMAFALGIQGASEDLSDDSVVVDGTVSDLPSGEQTESILDSVEEELLAKRGVASPKPRAEGDQTPAPRQADPDDPVEKMILTRFGGDRAAAAEFMAANPDRIRAIEDQLARMTAPSDPQAAEKSLEAEIRADGQVVEANAEIENIEAEIKNTHADTNRVLQSLAKAEREADRLDGQAEIAADDQKQAILARAAAKRSEIASLNSEYKANQNALKRSEKDLAHYQRALHSRVREIQASVTQRVYDQDREMAKVSATQDAFNSTVVSTAKDLKLKLNSEDLEFIRGKVTMTMRRDTGERDWPLSRIKALTEDVVRKYAVSSGRTQGARAVSLTVKAPSAPRPASQRVGTPTPLPPEKEAAYKDPNFWRDRARAAESRGFVGTSRGRRG